LEHEVLVFNAVGNSEERKKQRAGDVIGKVAADAQFFAAGKTSPVHGESVGFNKRHPAFRKLRAEPAGKIPVDFNAGEVPCAVNNFLCERGLSRTDFHEILTRKRADRIGNFLDPKIVVQKVLAESFSCFVLR
jgi:hypothetical protein